MRILLHSDPGVVPRGWSCELSSDDGAPQLSVFRLDLLPTSVSDHRLAAAITLPFLETTSSTVQSDGLFGPELTRVIRDFRSPADTHIVNYSDQFWTAKPSSGTLAVRTHSSIRPPVHDEDSAIELVPASSHRGWISSPRRRIIASNSDLHGELGGPFARAVADASVGILFSEDFDAGSIAIRCDGLDMSELQFLRDYLDAVALVLKPLEGR